MKLSTFIEKNLDAIVAEWEFFARSLVPEKQMTALALRNHCRQILLGVVEHMQVRESSEERDHKSKGWAPDPSEPESAATSHGALRQVAGFDLVQLFAEFRALRASVLALWQRAAGAASDAGALEENIRFNGAIDQALAESVKSYSSNVESSRDMFLAILGHDLRGPLSVINMANAILAKDELAQPMRQQAASRIKRASREMSRLITDLLEYTRSRLGANIPIERDDCDLGPLCREAVESIQSIHPAQRFELAASGNLRMHGDPARLQQVLSNLLNNAVQHGDPRAAITLHALGEASAVALRVGNAGRPIPPDALASIFEPLVQAAGGGTSGPDGRSKTSLGLGLFVVQQIIKGHAGTVTVESAEESGTLFTVRLPREVPSNSNVAS